MQILTIAVFTIFTYGGADEDHRHVGLLRDAAGLRQRLFIAAQIVRRAHGPGDAEVVAGEVENFIQRPIEQIRHRGRASGPLDHRLLSRFTQHRDARRFLRTQRQQIIFIFQQDNGFTGKPLRQRVVRRKIGSRLRAAMALNLVEQFQHA